MSTIKLSTICDTSVNRSREATFLRSPVRFLIWWNTVMSTLAHQEGCQVPNDDPHPLTEYAVKFRHMGNPILHRRFHTRSRLAAPTWPRRNIRKAYDIRNTAI